MSGGQEQSGGAAGEEGHKDALVSQLRADLGTQAQARVARYLSAQANRWPTDPHG